MRFVRKTLTVLALAVALPATASIALADEDAGKLTARIETQGRYYRAGEPMKVRVVLENLTEAPIANTEGIPIHASLEISQGDKGITKAASVPAFDPATQPRLFAPGTGYLLVVDLATLFPDLASGYYDLTLRSEEIESEPIELMVAHPYDPDLDYSATLKTDFGEITFDLLEEVAPEHVRNFVDLAKQGFYSGTNFHLIAAGEVVMGGSGTEERPAVPYFLAPELSSLQQERGTLCSVRTEGPDNGSQFFISLRRNPEFDGNFTVFGKMTGGEAALQSLEKVATSGGNFQPFYKPLEDTILREVSIVTKPSKEAAGGPGQSGDVPAGDSEGSD